MPIPRLDPLELDGGAVSLHLNARVNGLILCASLTIALSACSSEAGSPTGPSGGESPTVHDGLVVSTPAAEGIANDAIERLVSDASAQRSEALVVLRNGKIVYESYFGSRDEPIMAMSASKSFVSLAYGFMLADGSLPSLDDPVVKYLPAFADVDARKANVTIRHLLTQTSGLGPWRAMMTDNDIEAYAVASPLVFTPGHGWQYSNNGVDFLSALAPHIAGKGIDEILNEKLFKPMGISNTTWMRDAKGVPYGAGELSIRAIDLAKVGQMILDGGKWNGQQIVSADWIAQAEAVSSAYNPQYGLLWWRDAAVTSYALTDDLLDQWEGNGIATSITDKLRSGVGRTFTTYSDYTAFIRSMLASDDVAAVNAVLATGDHVPATQIATANPAIGYYFSGWLGQYLYIVPSKNLVAVRMRRSTESDYSSTAEANAFPTFFYDVYHLL